jgi:glycosyltransferase involved in cell wall biosynthesis
MNGLDHVVFWTEFAAYEAVRGGFKKPYSIIPLGVDLDLFKPGDRLEARRYLGLGPVFQESFIVGNINRNQPRKRFDLSIEAFAEWIKNYDAPDAALYLHVCPTGDMGYNLDELAGYYGLHNKFILCQPEVFRGATKRQVAATMRAFNVGFTTSVAEGWGLPVMETMASGVPNVVPHNSAYAEWAVGAAVSVPCRPVASLGIPSMGGEPSVEGMVEAFNRLYKDREFYKQVSEAGLARVREPKYRWENIGATWHEVLKTRYAEWLE